MRQVENHMQNPTFHELPILDGGLDSFIKLVSDNFPCIHNYFRGASRVSYDLIPTLGRLKSYKDASPQQKTEVESLFLSRSFQARTSLGPACYNEVAAAIMAQHHGAPTRLLDWSDSPLTALFFATQPKINHEGNLSAPESDAAVWVKHECPIEYSDDGKLLNRSFELEITEAQRFRDIDWSNGSSGFNPVILTPRLSAQLGSFSVCEKAHIDLREQESASITDIYKIIIPKNEILKIQEDLYRLGVRKRSIYPDEDGLNTSLVSEYKLDENLENRCTSEIDDVFSYPEN